MSNLYFYGGQLCFDAPAVFGCGKVRNTAI